MPPCWQYPDCYPSHRNPCSVLDRKCKALINSGRIQHSPRIFQRIDLNAGHLIQDGMNRIPVRHQQFSTMRSIDILQHLGQKLHLEFRITTKPQLLVESNDCRIRICILGQLTGRHPRQHSEIFNRYSAIMHSDSEKPICSCSCFTKPAIRSPPQSYFIRLTTKCPLATSLRWQCGHSFSMIPV